MASVKLENKSARILIIGLSGGASLTVPPTDPTTGIGAITVEMTDDDRARFDAAIATTAVKEWVDAGELVVTDEAEPEAKDEPEAGTKPPADDAPKPTRNPVPPLPEKKAKHGFFSGDKDKGEP